ncbi:hypothetical protein ACCT19_36140 [Rhizobium ruizarguesonis]
MSELFVRNRNSVIQNSARVIALSIALPAAAFAMDPSEQLSPTVVATASPKAPVKIMLGTFYHRENGCHSSSSTTLISIPNAEKLDRAHFGTMAGIEVSLTANNHGSFTQQVDDNQVIVTATASGPGRWTDNPVGRLFGGHGGGGWCVGAEGADIGGAVYGWFHQE